jgi:tocopherol O-methyltransferase
MHRMIDCSTVEQYDISSHYNLSTLFYRLFWGRHIHHGLWTTDELAAGTFAKQSNRAAQRLTETLAAEARIQHGEKVLDVGCGMGSSSIHLAEELGCEVTGITISAVQRRWAQCCSRWHRVGKKTTFLCGDAEKAHFDDSQFDVVWSIECTEHLFDKPRFFQNVARWVKPGGRVAICAWLAGDELNTQQAEQVHQVCEGFFCPSLGSKDDYTAWMTSAGLKLSRFYDWTNAVDRTWEICRERVRRSGMRLLAKLIGRNSVMFLDRFDTILNAYQSGAMKYGCFIAQRCS